MKSFVKSVVLSFILFFISIYVFQFFAPDILSLLIYPLASTIICSLIVFYITSSTMVTFISLLINNLFLLFVLIPLSSGVTYYQETLRFVLFSNSSHAFVNDLEILAALSLAIGYLTTWICKFISRYRSKDVFISDRTWKREYLS